MVVNYKIEENQKTTRNLGSLKEVRGQLNERLKEGYVTYRQLERTAGRNNKRTRTNKIPRYSHH